MSNVSMRWDPDREAWTPGAVGGAPVAVDSWLVQDGRVRGWELHWARFARACAEVAGAMAVDRRPLEAALEATAAPAAALIGAAAAAIPARGRWFPRVALHAGGQLELLMRPAPARSPVARLWLADRPDDRVAPRRKGADLERLDAWRARAVEHGADEVLLLDAEGRSLEAGYASLLWWEGDTLCAVPDDAPVLAGVTRTLVLALARERGVAVAHRRPFPAELRGREVWVTSALHGIRAVTALVGLGEAAPAARAAAWQTALEALSLRIAPGDV